MNLLAYKSNIIRNTFMVWYLSLCHIFCITFKEKYFFRYFLLTEQIPLYDCLYYFIMLLLGCWTICVLQLFFNLVICYDVKKFENNLVFPHDLKVGTKVENEKSL